MTLTRQLHLIWYVVLTLTLISLGLVVWVAVDALRRRGARWSAADLPAALRRDPELGLVMAVRLSVGDGPVEEVGVISQGPEYAYDLALLMRALAVEFETVHAERTRAKLADDIVANYADPDLISGGLEHS